MKKVIALVMTIVLIAAAGHFLLTNDTDRATASDHPVVSISTVYEEVRGARVDVNLHISGDMEDVAAGQLHLVFDEEKLSLIARDVHVDPVIQQGHFKDSSDQTEMLRAGEYRAAWASAQGEKLTDESIMTFTFRLSQAGQVADLTLADLVLFDENGDMIQTSVFNGAIKPFEGKDFTTGQSSDRYPHDKTWHVEVNDRINPVTLHMNSVFVLDRNNERVPVDLSLSSDGTKIGITPTGSGFQRGAHTLYITDQLQNRNGTMIEEPVKNVFYVQ
ncbi:hypothetical protein [Salisediminibacterium selenitireducens]|uniref:Cellulosome anchoring protein cohesin region n=1 Tax=Bacillus selenitireducens (strain ATCC 700615 / DSM 15326 / MLS10) TaxID=439292 RepID=D6Y075_BACIE|nr:hypothetical protein [Salisediminibacterium selenitireducens]ADH98466.1 hypothetical protein Bsel_0944 [[Bacillus] selenitireducens MLS10]